MNNYGSSGILCYDLLEMIGKKVEKNRLDNCFPILTNVITIKHQSWSSVNSYLSCKMILKEFNNITLQRPTKYLRDYTIDMDGDDLNYPKPSLSEINDIERETSYTEGIHYYTSYNTPRENTHVVSLLNSNIIKPSSETILNKEIIRKIINHKTHVKIESLEKTETIKELPDHFKYTKENIHDKLLKQYYDEIIDQDELIDILFNKNCLLYSDTSEQFILARYDNVEVEQNAYNNMDDKYEMVVDINYNEGRYTFNLDYPDGTQHRRKNSKGMITIADKGLYVSEYYYKKYNS